MRLPFIVVWSLVAMGAGLFAQSRYQPKISEASEDGRRRLATVKVDAAFERGLWAAEPQLANPVCFWVDHRGRVFVGETYRQEQRGVPDNRSFSYWLEDDLKSQTLADRRAMYLTHRPQFATQFTEHHDRITLLEDRDGDGAADSSKVFADGFNDILDGTGAGVLVRGNDVYYTCIPNVWLLQDNNDDGVADRRRILHTGYGIRIALRGHDLHGLVLGPDGRLYFSIGDRGYNIHTAEGKHLKCPWSGAVFRCELDGSQLELFATGLRNPQELAFDEHGNLFTADNNSDSADRARIVYVVEGGETGWRMNFQTRADRGGWVSEGWWKTRHDGQAAFLIPPLAHVGSGPSGFASYPGTGLPASYDGTFLMCDFRGGAGNSGVRSFKFEPSGAGFKVVDEGQLVWGALATDCDFGPDGTVFVSDWVNGWVGTGKGRIYTFRHEDAAARAAGDETAGLLSGSWSGYGSPKLLKLLGHADRRVRQEAQFELVNRGGESIRQFKAVALDPQEPRLARIHAMWGMGQMARKDSFGLMELKGLAPLVADADDEIRAQVIKLLGEHPNPYADHAALLRDRLADPSPRVRYFAALNLGRYQDTGDVERLLELARTNADEDVFIRHGCVVGLTAIGDVDALLKHKDDESAAARLAVVLALRRLNSTRVSEFLKDPDGYVATAAARAIYDVPIADAYPSLAGMLREPSLPGAPFARRALAAAELLGQAHFPELIAAYAVRKDVPVKLRVEALSILADWKNDREFDRILNMWRPRPVRWDTRFVGIALKDRLPGLLQAEPAVRRAAIRLVADYRMRAFADSLLGLVADGEAKGPTRVEALKATVAVAPGRLKEAVDAALASRNGRLRAAVADLLPRVDKDLALEFLAVTLKEGSLSEKRATFLTLGKLKDPRADLLLRQSMDRLLTKEQPMGTWLELLASARGRMHADAELAARVKSYDESVASSAIARYLPSLEGGDPARGRKVFMNKSETGCRRCHQVGDLAPTDSSVLAGPDLSDVGRRRDRRYLLESIVDPNAQITEEFQDWLVETKEDDVYRGRVVEEDEKKIVMEIKEFGEPTERVTVPKDLITFRKREKSPMPEDVVTKLTPSELRDLVAFLAEQKRQQ